MPSYPRSIPGFAAVAVVAALGGCTSLPLESAERAELKRIETLAPEQAAAARRAMADSQPHWPAEDRDAIALGEIRDGMNLRQVLFAWGIPSSRFPYPPSVSLAEEWRYDQVSPGIRLDVDARTWVRVRYADAEYPAFAHQPPQGRFGYRRVSDPTAGR